MSRFEQLEAIFLRGMIGTALITLLVAFAASWAARRAMLARLDMTNRTVEAIVEGDLSRRLVLRGDGDEFDMLARTVNGMLEQLELLVQNVKHSSSAIAHDLRTPLAELRADLEQLSVLKPPADEVLAGVELAIGDVDRVIAIFNAILRLAEVDTGIRRAGFKLLDAATVMQETTEFYTPLAEDMGVVLQAAVAPDLMIMGDALLLAQAIGNLIDNALKYGAGGRIDVSATRGDEGMIELTVADRGPGIPASEKDKVTERFYRLDPGRSTPGIGLGLSLVSAVARLHGGAFSLHDNHPGLRAVLSVAGSGDRRH